jgi:hypothetical protein
VIIVVTVRTSELYRVSTQDYYDGLFRSTGRAVVCVIFAVLKFVVLSAAMHMSKVYLPL